MSLSYDIFIGAFLAKITEYDLMDIDYDDRLPIVDGYMKRAISGFKKNCKYDLFSTADDNERSFGVDIPADDLDEIVDIVSEGMVVQWLKPYVYKQENLELHLNSRDWSSYSPAELLRRVGDAHTQAKKNYTNMIREYSYNHGDLKVLHI